MPVFPVKAAKNPGANDTTAPSPIPKTQMNTTVDRGVIINKENGTNTIPQHADEYNRRSGCNHQSSIINQESGTDAIPQHADEYHRRSGSNHQSSPGGAAGRQTAQGAG
jgi:hypothetical protein